MRFTDNLKLPLVESGDNLNLMDFYNNAMRILDQAYNRMLVDMHTVVKSNSDTAAIVSTLNNNVTNLTKAVDDLATKTAALGNSVDGMGQKVQANSEAIDALDARVTALEDK